MSSNYPFINLRKYNNYNNKKGSGNQKGNELKKAKNENKKLKIELNKKKTYYKTIIQE